MSPLDRNDRDREGDYGERRAQEQELVGIEEIKDTDPKIAAIKKQEIEGIVAQMNNLSDLFRDVSNLVVE